MKASGEIFLFFCFVLYRMSLYKNKLSICYVSDCSSVNIARIPCQNSIRRSKFNQTTFFMQELLFVIQRRHSLLKDDIRYSSSLCLFPNLSLEFQRALEQVSHWREKHAQKFSRLLPSQKICIFCHEESSRHWRKKYFGRSGFSDLSGKT